MDNDLTAYKNILITGGAGNLGRHVYEELKSAGHTVTLFDWKAPGEQPFPWECKDTMFVRGELTSLGDCMRAITLSQADCIVHLAALPHASEMQPGRAIPQRDQTEDLTIKSNVLGTYYVLDAARRLGVKKIVFASTFYTLGLGFRISDKPFQVDYLPMDEKHPSRPEDTYSLSKILGEEMIQTWCRAYGMKGVALRLMGISYPYRPHNMNYSIADRKKPDHVGGPIGGTGQFVDARDVAQAVRLMIAKDLEQDFDAFFISTDNSYTDDPKTYVANLLPDLVEMAKDLGPEDELISCQKLKDTFGYKPRYSWRNKKD